MKKDPKTKRQKKVAEKMKAATDGLYQSLLDSPDRNALHRSPNRKYIAMDDLPKKRLAAWQTTLTKTTMTFHELRKDFRNCCSRIEVDGSSNMTAVVINPDFLDKIEELLKNHSQLINGLAAEAKKIYSSEFLPEQVTEELEKATKTMQAELKIYSTAITSARNASQSCLT